MKLLAILLSLLLISLTRALYNCATPSDFEKFNPLFNDTFSEETRVEAGVKLFLHHLMFRHSEPIGMGGFGEIREYDRSGINLVIKKLVPKNLNQFRMMQNEVKVLKVISELNPELIYNKLEERKSDVIAGFYGCVEDGSDLYILQEKMSLDMESEEALLLYHALRGQQKANIMLQIISKFEELEKKKIVHGDIKPNNLMMKGNNFRDIRIIDFGTSDFEGKISRGSTPYLIPSKQRKNSALTFERDVYSLAVTFAFFELSTQKFMDKEMKKKCFEQRLNPPSGCEKKFRQGVIAAFNQRNETNELLSVMKTALEEKPEKRFTSMTKFKEAIEGVYSRLPSVGSPRKYNPYGVVAKFRRFFKLTNSIDGIIISSNSPNQDFRRFINQILAERKNSGLKMII